MGFFSVVLAHPPPGGVANFINPPESSTNYLSPERGKLTVVYIRLTTCGVASNYRARISAVRTGRTELRTAGMPMCRRKSGIWTVPCERRWNLRWLRQYHEDYEVRHIMPTQLQELRASSYNKSLEGLLFVGVLEMQSVDLVLENDFRITSCELL